MTRPLVRTLLIASVLIWATTGRASQTPQQPTFRAGTDLIRIEAQVVGKDSTPVDGLKADQFEVLIDGHKHPVTQVEFVRAATMETVDTKTGKATPAPASVADAPKPDGRIFILGIDQTSFAVISESAAREVVDRVIARLSPEDYLGLVMFPGPISIAPTRDRQAIRDGLKKMTGLLTSVPHQMNVSVSEAAAIKSNQVSTLNDVINRECCHRDSYNDRPAGRGFTNGLAACGDITCPDKVKAEASDIVQQLEMRASQSLGGIEAMFQGVAGIPGRKTVVIVSAGIPTANYPGARPDVNSFSTSVGQFAEKANANLYTLFMDVHFLQQFSGGRYNKGIFDDIQLLSRGLEQFSGAAGGTFYQVEVGPDSVVQRMVRETSAYYLLGVEPTPAERDGKSHFIDIRVNKGGATVRGRRTVTIPKSGGSTSH